MASKKSGPKTDAGKVLMANPEDLIRIVPLHLPDQVLMRPAGLAALPTPALSYRGGPLLSAVKVFTIYWGDAWNQKSQADLVSKLNAFFGFILTSPLIDQLTEYNVPNSSIHHGSFVGTITLPNPVPRAARAMRPFSISCRGRS